MVPVVYYAMQNQVAMYTIREIGTAMHLFNVHVGGKTLIISFEYFL